MKRTTASDATIRSEAYSGLELEEQKSGSSDEPTNRVEPSPSPDVLRIAGIQTANLTSKEAIERVARSLQAGTLLKLAFLNAHCVNVSRRDADYRERLSRFLVLPDGVGVDLAARLLYHTEFRENLNGTDFVPRLLGALPGPLTIALVGGAPGVARRAAARLSSDVPLHRFVAVSDGFFGADQRNAMLADLADAHADIVLVAMGVPVQEQFIDEHLSLRHARVAIGVGALFDFLAGNVSRAPRLVRDLRMEWAYRLALEPSRLWRRYVLGNPLFLLGILRDKTLSRRGDV